MTNIILSSGAFFLLGSFSSFMRTWYFEHLYERFREKLASEAFYHMLKKDRERKEDVSEGENKNMENVSEKEAISEVEWEELGDNTKNENTQPAKPLATADDVAEAAANSMAITNMEHDSDSLGCQLSLLREDVDVVASFFSIKVQNYIR
jgi:hypothetical protein